MTSEPFLRREALHNFASAGDLDGLRHEMQSSCCDVNKKDAVSVEVGPLISESIRSHIVLPRLLQCGWTALHDAVVSDKGVCVSELLQRGASLDVRTPVSVKPVHSFVPFSF
jgi:hypothetical protein